MPLKCYFVFPRIQSKSKEQWESHPPADARNVSSNTSLELWSNDLLFVNLPRMSCDRVYQIITCTSKLRSHRISSGWHISDSQSFEGSLLPIITACHYSLTMHNSKLYLGNGNWCLESILIARLCFGLLWIPFVCAFIGCSERIWIQDDAGERSQPSRTFSKLLKFINLLNQSSALWPLRHELSFSCT